jgi:hypothetical protein
MDQSTPTENNPAAAPRRNFWLLFFWSSLLGEVLGVVCGMVIARWLSCQVRGAVGEVFAAVVGGVLLGSAIAFFQLRLIKERLPHPMRWFAANIAGWTLAILLFEIQSPFIYCGSEAKLNSAAIEEIFNRVLEIGMYLELTYTGEVTYGPIYQGVGWLYTAVRLGLVFGLPTGLLQWAAFGKSMAHPFRLAGAAVLAWILVWLVALLPLNGTGFTILKLAWGLAAPAALSSLALHSSLEGMRGRRSSG